MNVTSVRSTMRSFVVLATSTESSVRRSPTVAASCSPFNQMMLRPGPRWPLATAHVTRVCLPASMSPLAAGGIGSSLRGVVLNQNALPGSGAPHSKPPPIPDGPIGLGVWSRRRQYSRRQATMQREPRGRPGNGNAPLVPEEPFGQDASVQRVLDNRRGCYRVCFRELQSFEHDGVDGDDDARPGH